MLEVLLGVGSLVIAIIGIYVGWWAPKAAQIRQRLREAEPGLYFTIGSYGGPGGQGLGMNLQNQSGVSAHDLALYLPGIEGVAWRAAEIRAGETPYVQISLAADAPIRTTPTDGLAARLVYHDAYGRLFIASLDLVQQPRADGFYNIGPAHQGAALVRPPVRFRDLWRLRKTI